MGVGLRLPVLCRLWFCSAGILVNGGMSMKHDKYLKVALWLRNRYTIDGRLVISTGGIPSRYKYLETLAWNKYILGA